MSYTYWSSALSFCLQISIVSTDDDLSWFLWNPTPTVVHGGSNSLYSATTCLSKCIMSLPVERTAAACGLHVNTMMKLVIFSQCKFSFFCPFWRSLTSFHNRGGSVFILRRTAEKRTSCLTPVQSNKVVNWKFSYLVQTSLPPFIQQILQVFITSAISVSFVFSMFKLLLLLLLLYWIIVVPEFVHIVLFVHLWHVGQSGLLSMHFD